VGRHRSPDRAHEPLRDDDTGKGDLAWTAATDNTGVALYNVHRGTLPGVVAGAGNRIGQSRDDDYRTRASRRAYYYVVTAQDAGGTVGPRSNEFGLVAQADVTPPSAHRDRTLLGASLSGVVTITRTRPTTSPSPACSSCSDGAALGAEDWPLPTRCWNTGLCRERRAHPSPREPATRAGTRPNAPNVGVTVSNTAIQGLVAAYRSTTGRERVARDSSHLREQRHGHGTTWTTSGHTLEAMVFASNSYADTPNSVSLDISGTRLTIEMWANITAGSSVDYVLVQKPWVGDRPDVPLLPVRHRVRRQRSAHARLLLRQHGRANRSDRSR
jgi:hypothetical protein